MEGPEEKSSPLPPMGDMEGVDKRGMIPRAVEQVFVSASELREKGWEVRKDKRQCVCEHMYNNYVCGTNIYTVHNGGFIS